MKPMILVATALVCLLLISSVTAQDSAMQRQTLQHDNRSRSYYVFLPATVDEPQPLPLVIAFHPSGGDGPSFADRTGFNALAERDNVIMVYPEGPYGYWDYGAGLPEWEILGDVMDDVGFFATLLDHLVATYPVDADQIYAIGYSNGARMAFRVGCEFADRLRGIGAVSATISSEVTDACPETSQLDVFYMHGTDDQTTPWDGKPLFEGGYFLSQAFSAPQTVAFWARQNGCPFEPEITDMPDENVDDFTTVQRVVFNDCAAHVEFYAVLGGGHGWLGGNLNLMPSDYQPSGSATDYLWTFMGFASR